MKEYWDHFSQVSEGCIHTFICTVSCALCNPCHPSSRHRLSCSKGLVAGPQQSQMRWLRCTMKPQASAQEVQPCWGLPEGKPENSHISLLRGDVHQLSRPERINTLFTSTASMERLVRKKLQTPSPMSSEDTQFWRTPLQICLQHCWGISSFQKSQRFYYFFF